MIGRIARGLLVATLAVAGFAWQGRQVAAQSILPCGTAMQVLVISSDGNEADLPAIRAALDYVGTPYDVFIGTQRPGGLTPDLLSSGCRALYQGVILTTDTAVSDAELLLLATYETTFSVRQVTWYTWPRPDDGFNWPSSVTDWNTPVTAQLTAAGAAVFPYIRTDAGSSPIVIRYAQTFHATPLDATTTPLLIDDSGNALAAIHSYPDGHVNLAMTFDSNPYLLHSMLLSYGVVNWVTRGLFIGERHTYLSAQVDDVFIDDEQWLASTPCGTGVDNTGVAQRITGADLTAVSAWQNLRRQDPLSGNLRITMAFNGLGTTSKYDFRVVGSNDALIGGVTGGPQPDTLTPATKEQQQNFFWASHTFDHLSLDAISYAAASLELTQNNAVATDLGLQRYSLHFMVQPLVSGLTNASFLKAAYDNGIRYLLSDTSKAGQGNPAPNTGFWNIVGQPGIFVIPRRPNNLFFNVAAPADWVQEYNCLYTAYWGRDLTYDEILDTIGWEHTARLMRGELDPWMFHQTNLAAYDGTHTLLTDLLDRILRQYGSYMTVPVVSPDIEEVGARMAARTNMRAAGISATMQRGVAIQLTSPIDITVPITGLHLNRSEWYGGQWISWVPLKANVTTTLPLAFPAESNTSGFSDGAGPRSVDVTTSQAGELLLAFVSADGPIGQSMTVSAPGLTWALVKRANLQAGTSEIWMATALTPLSTTVTSTPSVAGYHQSLTIVGFAGAGGVGASAATGAATRTPNVSLVTTRPNSLVFAVGADTKHAVTPRPGANQTTIHQFVDTAAADTFWVQALTAPVPWAGTAVKLTNTAPTRHSWNFAAVEIVPATVSTAVPVIVNMSQVTAVSAIAAAGPIVESRGYVDRSATSVQINDTAPPSDR